MQEEYVTLYTDSNPRSGSNWEPWRDKAAMLCIAPLCQQAGLQIDHITTFTNNSENTALYVIFTEKSAPTNHCRQCHL